MADDVKDKAADDDKDKAAETRFKKLLNEVLDERAAKAQQAKDEAAKLDAEKAEKLRAASPMGMLESFLGFTSKKD